RVCVVGAGRAGMMHAENFRRRVPYARLEAVVDVEPEHARQAAEELDLEDASYTSLEQALESADIDAVVITTPSFTHAELAVMATQAGKHIFCEKPMALTLEDCDRMIEAAQTAGVILQMAFMRRFDPPFVAAKQQIDEGLIGRPLIVHSLTRGPGLPPPWACDLRTSNGMLAEVNSHDFDTIRWLAGGNYTNVFAQASTLKAPDLKKQYPGFYDTAVVILRLDNGALGMLDGVCPVDYGYDARAEVVGSEGVLFIGELREAATTRVTREDGMVERHFLSWRTRFAQAYVNEATHFVDCIRNQEEPAITGFDGRCAVEGVLAANQSIRTGQPVALPLAG
ncbi:MAG: Gfo/Idh/MocA family oxidoreductase, partial [Dehalococcoidia bacterium]